MKYIGCIVSTFVLTQISYAAGGLSKIFDSSHGLPGSELKPGQGDQWVTKLLAKTANTLLDITAIIAVIGVCVVGYIYITSLWKEEGTAKAKKYLIVIIVWVIIALTAWAMISLVDLIPTSVKF